MKKPLILVLLMALAASSGGCGSGTPKPPPTATPRVNIQVSVGLPGLLQAVSGKPSGDMNAYFTEKFGIEFMPWTPSQADWEAGIRAAAASKSLPDLFEQGIYDNRMLLKELIDQGLVREIPESVYKNYHFLGTTMYRYAKSESVGGKMYFVPRADMAQQYNNGRSVALYYRLDWALESGVLTAGQAPSWQQFMGLMGYYAHDDPDKDGHDDTWGLTCAGPGLSGLKTAFMMAFGVRDWVLEGGKWIPGVLSSKAEEAVKWANQAFRTGCLDPEFSTQDEEAAIDKFCSGQAGLLVADASPAGAAHINEVLQVKQPGIDIIKAVSVLPQPTGPWGVSYNEDVSYDTGILFSSSVGDDKLKSILSLMDWLYGGEGQTYVNWGKAGKDYNVTGGGLQTLHKDADGFPVTFSRLNAEWGAMATLSTWGKDFIPGASQADYRLKYLSALKDFWWPNDWRRPMFTRYIFDQSVQDFDSDGRAEAALADMIVKSTGIDADWQAYVAKMNSELNVEAVAKVVNDYAKENNITTEE